MSTNKPIEWYTSWKKLHEKWQHVSSKGQQNMLKIADCIQKNTYLERGHWGILSDCTTLHEGAQSHIWELIHRCRKRLNTDRDTLCDIVIQMREIQIEGKLNHVHIMHQTFLNEIVAMFQQELIARSLMIEDIIQCERHDTLTMYIATWQMQPHIDHLRIQEISELIQTKD